MQWSSSRLTNRLTAVQIAVQQCYLFPVNVITISGNPQSDITDTYRPAPSTLANTLYLFHLSFLLYGQHCAAALKGGGNWKALQLVCP